MNRRPCRAPGVAEAGGDFADEVFEGFKHFVPTWRSLSPLIMGALALEGALTTKRNRCGLFGNIARSSESSCADPQTGRGASASLSNDVKSNRYRQTGNTGSP
jgi:hypothetical protein